MEELFTNQEELIIQLEKALKNFTKTPHSRLNKIYIEVKLNLLEGIWSQFVENHKMIVQDKESDKKSDYFVKDYYSLAEDSYTLAKCKMLEKLEEYRPKIAPPPQAAPSSQPVVRIQPEVKLPQINLPKFSGKYSEWLSFHDLFVSLIHNETAISNVQKLHYLKSSLSGEAEALLRHIPVTEANYEDAWETLKKRYHNRRFIVNEILKRLMTQKSVMNESSQAIKAVLDTTNECLSALKNLKVPIFDWDPILVYIVVSKMDKESVKLWEQSISMSDEVRDGLPTYKQLCCFLESRFRTLEVLESSKTPTRTPRPVSFHASTSTKKTYCSYCKGEHFIHYCKEFAQLTYTDKKTFIEKKGLCFNCLIPKHMASECKQKTTCRRCGKKHHSLIHPEYKPTDKASDDNAGGSHIQEKPKTVATTPVDHNVAAHFAEGRRDNQVLLATALIKTQSQNGTTYYLRALIDPGSQGSFITESATQLLGLKKTPINCSIKGLGDERCLKSNKMVIFKAHSRYESKFEVPVRAFVLKTLTRMLPTRQVQDVNWTHLHQLNLADPDYGTPGKIDVLLGADVFGEIVTEGLMKGPRGSPTALNTHFGWILSGQLQDDETIQSYNITLSMHNYIEEDKLLLKFWELESDVACQTALTDEEIRCEKHFEQTHKRDADGRYVVALPFKSSDPSCQYGESKQVAETRFLQLERKLKRDTELKEEYGKIMKEYLELEHMEEVVDEKDKLKENAVYLPHHAVVRKDKTTTKVRVVHDASCKYKNGTSLNDDLMVGPRLQQDLRHIIMRWRLHKVCLVADIIKMYRQIKVTSESADFQRLLWREDHNLNLNHFKMTRVTFGLASAPYLATKVLQQLAKDDAKLYPVASEITLTDFYMDDLLTGGDSYEDAMLIYHQITQMLKAGGFEMQKWNSNDREVLKSIEAEEQTSRVEPEKELNLNKTPEKELNLSKIPEKELNLNKIPEKDLNLDMTVKTLGIAWNNTKDQFQYSVDLPEMKQPITKRHVASDVSKLFDPMGWLAPTIIIGKNFLQRLWLTGVGWDQEVNKEIRDDWIKFRSDLPYLSEIIVDRWLGTQKHSKFELYGFSDASTMAYAAVVYLRVKDEHDNTHVSLISAKTKVAPVRTISVPRLELCGAVLLTRLLNEISEHLKVERDNIYAYTDSKVVLAWIQSHPCKWKTFVANRTSEIISTLPSKHWNHVKSKENPADLASRGVQPSKLKHETLWWKGPNWLYDTEIPHEVPTDIPGDLKLEERSVHFSKTTELEDSFNNIFERYSTLEKLLRVIARCKRFRHAKSNRYPAYLTVEELDTAMSVCILLCQKDEFAEEISYLREGKPLKKTSKLRLLNPFLDKKGILRVGGRLRHANIPEDAKHQIILPDCYFSKLIIADTHKKTLHGGPTLMLNYVRQRFWILNGKRLIKQEVHKCVVCVRYKAATQTQLMGDLPKQRVTPTRPFLNSGIDFAGPIDLRMSKGRGCKTYKGYICIFICMATHAIHIEIVSGLDAESFVAAFKRFTARRGHCSDIWSDNATNFIAGNKMLKDMLKTLIESTETNILDKFHLKRILGNSTLTYEEMSTVTAQIEACLNSRPISPVSDDINDILPLTPGHFLIGEPPIVVPEKSYLDVNINRLNRWQLAQRLVQHFWDRWTKEYLSRLQQRPKWSKINENVKIGSLVLVKDDNLPPGKWSLARVLDLHPGADGLIRVVSLKCKNSVIKRPIVKICLLPVDTPVI